MTQSQLAQKTGIKRTTLSYIERGTGNPSLYYLHRLARFFNIPLWQLFETRFSIMKESGEEQFLPDLPVGWQSAKEAIPAQSKKILPLNHYQKLWIVVLEGEVFVSDGRLFNFLGRGQALKVQGECVVKIANGQANAAQILQIQNSPP